MKKAIIVMMIMVSGTIFAKDYTAKDTENGIIFHDDEGNEISPDRIQSGKIHFYDETGTLRKEFTVENGKENGNSIFYRESGIKETVPYKDDKKNGRLNAIDETGAVRYTVDYLNDVKNGEETEYTGGKVSSRCVYENGIPKSGVFYDSKGKEVYRSNKISVLDDTHIIPALRALSDVNDEIINGKTVSADRKVKQANAIFAKECPEGKVLFRHIWKFDRLSLQGNSFVDETLRGDMNLIFRLISDEEIEANKGNITDDANLESFQNLPSYDVETGAGIETRRPFYGVIQIVKCYATTFKYTANSDGMLKDVVVYCRILFIAPVENGEDNKMAPVTD